MWRVPFVRPDLPRYADVAEEMEASFSTASLTKGTNLRRFEEDVAAVVGTEHAVGVSSCTTGLMLVLRSLDAIRGCRATGGCVRPCAAPSRPAGRVCDEVIVPSFIFLAAPTAIVWAGFRPVFVDVNPETFTVDPSAVEEALSPRTAAILACHTFGSPCNVAALEAVGEPTGVPVVIDAAHGFGASAHGHHVGRGGLAQVFSLSPTKLVVAGEGGMVATSCDCLADLVRIAREYGNDGHYGCDRAGVNGRMPELSAIVGRASLARLPEVAARRRAAAQAYFEVLGDLPGIGFQRIPDGCVSSWKDFSISVDPHRSPVSRDEMMQGLADRGIDSRAYYSPACHRMAAFKQFVDPSRALAVTDRLADTLVALPMGAHVTPEVASEVAREVRNIVARGRSSAHA